MTQMFRAGRGEDGQHERPVDEERYRALLDALPASVFTLKADLSVDYVNKYWVEYSGMAGDTHPGREVGRLIHRDDLERMGRELPELLLRGQPFTFEYRVRQREGPYRWHLSRTVPARDANGNIVGWTGTSVDIDDSKRAEEVQAFLASAGAVLASSLDFDVTLSNLARITVPYLGDGCAIDLLDEKGEFYIGAVAHCDPGKEHVAREMRQRFPPKVGGPHPAARVIETGEPMVVKVDPAFLASVTFDPDHLARAEALHASVALTVPIVSRGRRLGAMTFLREARGGYSPQEVALAVDVGRRAGLAVENARLFREAHMRAEELHRANNAKDEFLGLVSHELRTPLTTIAGNAEVLLRPDEISPELRRRALMDIRNDADRLQRLVENMLALSHVEKANELDREPTLLQRELPRLVANHRRRHPEREIVVAVEPELSPVLAQPTYLEQVVANLLSNAEKYSPAGTLITVRARREGAVAVLSVEDRGAGIAPEDLEQVFAPFYRTGSAKGIASGLGLGLAVCRRLIDAQGGRIWAEAGKGGGTTICFTLPCE
ncbi:MAG: ATP-binding protein [Hyphomicrobiales bacterium]